MRKTYSHCATTPANVKDVRLTVTKYHDRVAPVDKVQADRVEKKE